MIAMNPILVILVRLTVIAVALYAAYLFGRRAGHREAEENRKTFLKLKKEIVDV